MGKRGKEIKGKIVKNRIKDSKEVKKQVDRKKMSLCHQANGFDKEGKRQRKRFQNRE